MANYSRKQSNHGYADWYLGSDEVKNEKAYIEETNADEYAYPLNAEFHTYIPTPRLFRDYKSSSIEMEAALDDLINQISSINRTRNSEKADGSALSFMGSLLAIAGTVAAPFTLGGSLLLVGTGIAMSIGGSEVSSEAETRMASEISNTLQEAQAYLNDYKNQELKWTYAAQLLNEIVDDLKNVFNELEFSFSNLVRCIEHVSYSDMSSNGVLNAAKGSCLRAAIGKPKVAYTTTKQVLTSGRQVIRSVQKTTQVSQSAKMVSSAVDGTARVVKTERTVHAVGTTITKETAIVTKNVSRLGLALGVVFAVVDLYQLDKAVTASQATCDAEKELRSCKEHIKRSSNEVMAQVETYKQVMKIKAFFQSLLNDNKPFLFRNVSMPLEQVCACVDKINTLCQMMSYRCT